MIKISPYKNSTERKIVRVVLISAILGVHTHWKLPSIRELVYGTSCFKDTEVRAFLTADALGMKEIVMVSGEFHTCIN